MGTGLLENTMYMAVHSLYSVEHNVRMYRVSVSFLHLNECCLWRENYQRQKILQDLAYMCTFDFSVFDFTTQEVH